MLGVFGAANRGKSETLLMLINIFELDDSYTAVIEPKVNPSGENDKIAIFERKNLRIGITSIGDTKKQVDKSVRELVEARCDVIVTATRTSGGTIEAFNQISKEHGYKDIWFDKNKNVDWYCERWPHKGSDFDTAQETFFLENNKLDSAFIFNYLDSLTKKSN
jgi:hypothetical protein